MDQANVANLAKRVALKSSQYHKLGGYGLAGLQIASVADLAQRGARVKKGKSLGECGCDCKGALGECGCDCKGALGGFGECGCDCKGALGECGCDCKGALGCDCEETGIAKCDSCRHRMSGLGGLGSHKYLIGLVLLLVIGGGVAWKMGWLRKAPALRSKKARRKR